MLIQVSFGVRCGSEVRRVLRAARRVAHLTDVAREGVRDARGREPRGATGRRLAVLRPLALRPVGLRLGGVRWGAPLSPSELGGSPSPSRPPRPCATPCSSLCALSECAFSQARGRTPPCATPLFLCGLLFVCRCAVRSVVPACDRAQVLFHLARSLRCVLDGD